MSMAGMRRDTKRQNFAVEQTLINKPMCYAGCIGIE